MVKINYNVEDTYIRVSISFWEALTDPTIEEESAYR